jgi:hypothetical protein
MRDRPTATTHHQTAQIATVAVSLCPSCAWKGGFSPGCTFNTQAGPNCSPESVSNVTPRCVTTRIVRTSSRKGFLGVNKQPALFPREEGCLRLRLKQVRLSGKLPTTVAMAARQRAAGDAKRTGCSRTTRTCVAPSTNTLGPVTRSRAPRVCSIPRASDVQSPFAGIGS